MMKTKFALLLLSSCFLQISSLYPTDKKVEFVANFEVSAEGWNQILAKRKVDFELVGSDLSAYKKALKRSHKPWKQFFKEASLYFSHIPLNKGVSKIIFWNVSTGQCRKLNLSLLPKEQMVLFMWEPPVVLKEMYTPEITACFSRIYTWDDDLVDQKTYFKFFYPVWNPMIEEIPSFEQKKLCTFVSSNLKSSHPNELYTEREKAITFFEHMQEDGFEFYGRGWNVESHPSYRGVIADKIGMIKNYRFSICYENTQGCKGYITEKIFDCFAAGNVPIYLGADNVTDYIPKDCFIDKRDFEDLDALYRFIKVMSKEEYEGYIERIRAFLKSPEAQLFSPTHFEDLFCEAVSAPM
jgi:hypothetical protein